MSFSGLLEKIDDRINPIVVKELRQAVKSRMVVAILMLFLGLQLFLLGVFLFVREMTGDDTVINWNAGSSVFAWQQGILLWTLMLFVPAYAAIRLGAERSDHNVDLLFISTLHPRSIIAGKLFAALVLAMLVFSTCAPFMTFTYLLRGIDIPTILTVLGIDLLAMLFSTMLALFVAGVPGGRAIKFVLAFIGFVVLIVVCSMLTTGTLALVSEGAGVFETLFDVWTVAAVTITGVLGLVGLLFCYSVALISPPSSNRVMPVRIYLFALWVVMGVSLFLTSYYYRTGYNLYPIAIWLLCAGTLISVQFCVSICERERWGLRMARSIPRNVLLRIPAFLFYTGSAGGILLMAMMALATLCGSWAYCEWMNDGPTPRGYEGASTMLTVMTSVCLYTFCYGLSAVLVRTHVLAGQLKSVYTWLVALLLVGLGSSIPSVIAWIFFSDQLRYNTDSGWWMLPNPFVAVYELIPGWSAGRGNDEFQTLCFWFLGVWTVLVSVLALPWLIVQMGRFRPRKRELDFAAVSVVAAPPVATEEEPLPMAAVLEEGTNGEAVHLRNGEMETEPARVEGVVKVAEPQPGDGASR